MLTARHDDDDDDDDDDIICKNLFVSVTLCERENVFMPKRICGSCCCRYFHEQASAGISVLINLK